MKKSLIALAVAGAFAAPAFAATGNVDIYGIVNVAIQDLDSSDDTHMTDNASRLGFKGSEDLGGGLKAIWQIESSINVGGNNDSTLAKRNTFVGLAGDFGTFLMGRHDTPYKIATGSMDLFADSLGDYEDDFLGLGAGLNDAHDARVDSAVAYISPAFNGFTFAGAVVMNGALDTNDIDATSLALLYGNGPLNVSLAYQTAEAETVGALATGTLSGIETDDSDAWKIGASYAFGDITVVGIYENVDVDNVGDVDTWLIGAKYAMGPVTLKTHYTTSEVNPDAGGDADADMWALGVDYNLSKRTTAYVVYATGDSDHTADNDGWQVGLKHSF